MQYVPLVLDQPAFWRMTYVSLTCSLFKVVTPLDAAAIPDNYGVHTQYVAKDKLCPLVCISHVTYSNATVVSNIMCHV